LPLTGKPTDKQPVVIKKTDGNIREYPEYFTPIKELAENEMRVLSALICAVKVQLNSDWPNHNFFFFLLTLGVVKKKHP
jgi:hypothetical protein